MPVSSINILLQNSLSLLCYRILCLNKFCLKSKDKATLALAKQFVILKTRDWKLHPGFPCGWQAPKYLNYHLLPPGMHISRKMEEEIELGLEPRHSSPVLTELEAKYPHLPVMP